MKKLKVLLIFNKALKSVKTKDMARCDERLKGMARNGSRNR